MERWSSVFSITDVYVHDLHPPVAVVSSFRDVFSAQEDMAVDINQAQAYMNDQGPRAKGRAYAIRIKSQASAIEHIYETQGKTMSMIMQSKAYLQNPEAIKFIRYMKELSEILLGKKLIVVGQGIPKLRYLQRDSK